MLGVKRQRAKAIVTGALIALLSAPAAWADEGATAAAWGRALTALVDAARARITRTAPEPCLTADEARLHLAGLPGCDQASATLQATLAAYRNAIASADDDETRCRLVAQFAGELALLERKMGDRADGGCRPYTEPEVRAILYSLVARLRPARPTEPPVQAGRSLGVVTVPGRPFAAPVVPVTGAVTVATGSGEAVGGAVTAGTSAGTGSGTSGRPAASGGQAASRPAATPSVRRTDHVTVRPAEHRDPPSGGAGQPTVKAKTRATVETKPTESSWKGLVFSTVALTVFALALLAIGMTVWRRLQHSRDGAVRTRLDEKGIVEPEHVGLAAPELRTIATRAKVDRDWFKALRYLWAAVLVELEAAGRLRIESAATNLELVAALQAPAKAQAVFAFLAGTFDLHFYGRIDVTEEDYRECDEAVVRLRDVLDLGSEALNDGDRRSRIARVMTAGAVSRP